MTKKMIRVTLESPGQLRLGEAPVPAPQPGEVLIEVRRVGVCGSDPTIFRGRHPYVSYPVVMGHEFSGVVAGLGAGTSGFSIGDRVAVIPHLVCGQCPACRTESYNFCEQLRCTGAEADGAHVGFIAMPAAMVLRIPDQMSLDDAAMMEPACVGYHAAKRGEIRPDDTVLVIGAGPIGNFCMQSCRALGAKRVLIADKDGDRLSLATALGADGTINVGRETLAEGLARLVGGAHAVDVFFDCVGEKGLVLNQILELARRGTRVVVAGVLQNGCDIPHLPDFVQHELRLSGTTMYVPQDYREMAALMGRKAIRTQGMITHYFKLSDVISVFALIERGQEKFFKIMLTVNDEEQSE